MNKKETPFDERINQINDATGALCNALNNLPHSDERGTILEISEPLIVLMGSIVMSGAEITAQLNAIGEQLKRIADGLERDITEQVKNAAETRAEQLNEERTKRNFIGQPKK